MKRIFINNKRDLISLKDLKGGEYIVKLTSNLDFKGDMYRPIYINGSNIIFDGDGYTIKNVYIGCPDKDVIGMFNTVKGSMMTLKNLNLENINVMGRNYVGLIGGIFNGSINNCRVEGIVVGNSIVGALVGESDEKFVVNYSNLHILPYSIRSSAGVILGRGKKLIVRACNIVAFNEEGKIIYCPECEEMEIEGLRYPLKKNARTLSIHN